MLTKIISSRNNDIEGLLKPKRVFSNFVIAYLNEIRKINLLINWCEMLTKACIDIIYIYETNLDESYPV